MKEIKELQKNFIGIDVSKLTIDVCLVNHDGLNEHQQFRNNLVGFKKMLSWLFHLKVVELTSCLFCMEHTGIYTRELVQFLMLQNANVWMESALHLKRSMGMTRGKNDKVDSYRIARYALTNADQAKLVSISNKTLQLLKDMMSSRERIHKAYQAIEVSIKEMEQIDKTTGKELRRVNKSALSGLKKSKLAIEARMFELISNDDAMNKIYNLITSIKGVGAVLATELIVYTHLFQRLDTPKQLACYCGVAPFAHTSGTSIKGKMGTSNFANMNLKSTLHLAALSATRYVPDLRIYYERKVGEGKSKMSVINAVRNKILFRVLAVVKRGTPYVENYINFNLENS